jgi:hypothetical protein
MTASHVRPDSGKPCRRTTAGPLPSLRQWIDAEPTVAMPSLDDMGIDRNYNHLTGDGNVA